MLVYMAYGNPRKICSYSLRQLGPGLVPGPAARLVPPCELEPGPGPVASVVVIDVDGGCSGDGDGELMPCAVHCECF